MTALSTFALRVGLLCVCVSLALSTESRVAVLQQWGETSGHAFRVENGQLYQMLSFTGTWAAVTVPGGNAVSNPVTEQGDKWGLVFVQAQDGQVYYGLDIGDGLTKLRAVSASAMPQVGNATADLNSLIVFRDNTTLHLFAKSKEHRTQLYWSRANASSDAPVFSSWKQVGGDKVALAGAAAAAVNLFTHYVEVVAVMTDGKIYHSWQTNANEFHDWDHFSDIFHRAEPDVAAAPLLRANSGRSIFNGRLELFVLGTDGFVHHIGQTTCDKVMNPWSECTWGFYERLDNHPVPTALSRSTPLVIGSNAHGGLELFTVDKSFKFWHMWQIEEGKSYHTWEQAGSAVCQSAPSVYQDATGYWQAYVLDSNMHVQHIVQPRSMGLKPGAGPISSGSNVTVSWSVPEDEATNADWIGIYRHGDANDRYLDFAYVQGLQNPLHEPVPVGNITRRSVLGNGLYDFRYLVNRKFVNVLEQSLEFNNYTRDSEGTQLYHGLAYGLGKDANHFDSCYEDGNHTVAAFKQAFEAFEDRHIATGLQLFGVGLKDLKDALVACEETTIAERLEKFIKDLIKCTKSDCTSFLIDVLGELVTVFYEDVHEIYGDIRGAQNCFKYELYEQGGVNVGRVVSACIDGPTV